MVLLLGTDIRHMPEFLQIARKSIASDNGILEKLDNEERHAMEIMDFIVDHLPLFMFLMMGILLFSGYPVAFILGGVSITFGFSILYFIYLVY